MKTFKVGGDKFFMELPYRYDLVLVLGEQAFLVKKTLASRPEKDVVYLLFLKEKRIVLEIDSPVLTYQTVKDIFKIIAMKGEKSSEYFLAIGKYGGNPFLLEFHKDVQEEEIILTSIQEIGTDGVILTDKDGKVLQVIVGDTRIVRIFKESLIPI